jgi:polysaccharide biosynthesis/export protein
VDRPGSVPMANGRLNLVQALSTAGLSKPYDHEKIRLIRTLSPTRGQLMVVDLAMMMNGRAMPLPLQDGDIVFVPKTALGGWNEVISELLPTAQLAGAIVSPFLWADALED